MKINWRAMLGIAGLVLALLGTQPAAAAPSKLVDAPQGGNLPFDFYIAACTASGPPNCGPVTYRPKSGPWYCESIAASAARMPPLVGFQFPVAPGPYSCWVDNAPATPANPLPVWGTVTPPVVVPPVAMPLPVNLGQNFTTAAITWVRLCNPDLTACSTAKLLAATVGGHYFCTVAAFTSPPANASTCVVYTPPPAVADQPCWSLNPLDYKFDELSAADSSYYTDAISWQSDCNGKYEVQLYSDIEFAVARLEASKFTSREAINAWILTQQARTLNASERAAVTRIRAKYAPVVVPPTATGFKVQPVSTTVVGDRPVYKKNADGTRNTTAIPSIRVLGNKSCSATDKIGTTSYRSVKGQVGTSGAVITGDYYAACVASP